MVSSTPRPHFTPGKDPVPIVQEAGLATGPVWTGGKISSPTGIRSPDRPARSSVAIPTDLTDPHITMHGSKKRNVLLNVNSPLLACCSNRVRRRFSLWICSLENRSRDPGNLTSPWPLASWWRNKGPPPPLLGLLPIVSLVLAL